MFIKRLDLIKLIPRLSDYRFKELSKNLLIAFSNEENPVLIKINNLLILAFRILNDREKYVIEQRFNFSNKKTLREIGIKLCISPEKVRQIEGRGIRKLSRFNWLSTFSEYNNTNIENEILFHINITNIKQKLKIDDCPKSHLKFTGIIEKYSKNKSICPYCKSIITINLKTMRISLHKKWLGKLQILIHNFMVINSNFSSKNINEFLKSNSNIQIDDVKLRHAVNIELHRLIRSKKIKSIDTYYSNIRNTTRFIKTKRFERKIYKP